MGAGIANISANLVSFDLDILDIEKYCISG